jgi:hypothetical protein
MEGRGRRGGSPGWRRSGPDGKGSRSSPRSPVWIGRRPRGGFKNGDKKMLHYIRAVKTPTGSRVRANLPAKRHPRGIEISDGLTDQINVRGGRVLPAWNPTIRARLFAERSGHAGLLRRVATG